LDKKFKAILVAEDFFGISSSYPNFCNEEGEQDIFLKFGDTHIIIHLPALSE